MIEASFCEVLEKYLSRTLQELERVRAPEAEEGAVGEADVALTQLQAALDSGFGRTGEGQSHFSVPCP